MPGEVHVGSQPPEILLDATVMVVELIELGVDVLGLARRREHRHGNQHDEAAEPERRDDPGLQPHVSSGTCRSPSVRHASTEIGIRQQGRAVPGQPPAVRGPLTVTPPKNGRFSTLDWMEPVTAGDVYSDDRGERVWRATMLRLGKPPELPTSSASKERAEDSPGPIAGGWNRVIVLANRAPVRHDCAADGARARQTRRSGGLVTALEPFVEACSGTWVAHGAGNADLLRVDDHGGLSVPPANPRYRLRYVWLPED